LAQGASVGPESARRLDGCPAFNAIIEDSEIEYFRDYPKVANDHEVLSALEGICKVTREKNQPDVISCAKKDILSIIEKLEPTTKISLLRNMANEIEKEN
jgi:pyrroloquinoline quinone (PQQ) biosynthesis protein C